MSVMNKPDYKIFAQDAKSGEYVAFPDILRGWGITLEQYNGFPPMELFNSAAKRIDEWLMYLTQRGLPEWDAAVDYPKDAMIQHAGVYYVSLKTNKGEQPNNSQASWKKLTELFADVKRFHTSPDSVEMITPNGSIIIELTNNGYVNIINKSTGLLAEIPPGGLEQQAGSHQKRMMSQKGVTDLVKSVETPVGMFATFPHRAAQLPPKWYSTNGDRFSVSSPQGLVLKSLPAELKSDWGITESGGMINVPNIKQSDGRTPFLRPVNGTERQVGSVDGDKMRRMQGEYANSSWRDPGGGWGGASGVFGVRYATGTSGTAGSNQGTTLVFDSEKVVPTGAEFKPLDIGVTLAIYLGV